jgi:hypothetical protein
MFNIAQIKARAHIVEIWSALGGGELRRGRGRAFWRGGHDYNVAVYRKNGKWWDFVTGVGGDVIALVETVRQCDFREALAWLSDHTGVPLSNRNHHDDAGTDTAWTTDLKWAIWWSVATKLLAEQALESLPDDHEERYGLTVLLSSVSGGDASLVAAYRKWRHLNPEWTTALARAGRRSGARLPRRVALWFMSHA